MGARHTPQFSWCLECSITPHRRAANHKEFQTHKTCEKDISISNVAFYVGMSIKYWEFEDAPLREKLKNPSVKEIAKIYFDNETKAYRFALALDSVKHAKELRLKDCSTQLPIPTWKRYLDYGVSVGLLKHENNTYSFTDRYSRPLKNISTYIKAWVETDTNEDLNIIFANAKTEKQKPRTSKKTDGQAQNANSESTEQNRQA